MTDEIKKNFMTDKIERGFWRTKSGEVLRISLMETRHLINTIRYLERRATVLRMKEMMDLLSASSTLNGEMALMSVDQEMTYISSLSDAEYMESRHEKYRELSKELKRRIRTGFRRIKVPETSKDLQEIAPFLLDWIVQEGGKILLECSSNAPKGQEVSPTGLLQLVWRSDIGRTCSLQVKTDGSIFYEGGARTYIKNFMKERRDIK